MWLNTKNRKVYKSWFGWLAAALWKPSLYNSEPLKELVYDNIFPEQIFKKLRVGAVSIPDGKYKVWTEEDPDILEGILASSAFPGMLTPIQARGKTWLDGGLRRVTPIKDAIEEGATDIDVIMTAPKR
ncbi:MAG: hypothetical protein GWN14_25405, partial [candidate division Zixibacteria bacterium]|nr:hypothetical protein [candidate division Zixibacteria bacterium]